MQNITLSTPQIKSVIRCGSGAFAKYAPQINQAEQFFLITDTNVKKFYGDLISKTFGGACLHVFPAGEKSKNYTVLLAILKHMVASGMTRACTVVAFGGGVVGDVAGLAASLYMRGVKLVQIPTTLLSQVDSSVGGKTAIDLCGVKNVIGTFYQPAEVIVDPLFLHTLPAREIRCGLGEIVKYGALNGEIYGLLNENLPNLKKIGFLEKVIAPCIKHKAEIVSRDERDLNGARKSLNLGHTTGHAFELYYKRKSHGEFVLIGSYYELFIAEKEGVCESGYAQALRKLILKVLGKVPAYADVEKAAELAKHDKKNEKTGEISLIVPKEVGECTEIILPFKEYETLLLECSKKIGGVNV